MIQPTFWTDPRSNNDYYLTVQYPEGAVKTLDDIRDIPLRAPDGLRATTLGAISELRLESGPTEVTHYALRKVVDAYVTLSSEDYAPRRQPDRGHRRRHGTPRGRPR